MSNSSLSKDKLIQRYKAEIKRLKKSKKKRIAEGIEARKKWREEAAEELRQIIEEKEEQLKKRPWYKKIFKLV